MLENDEEIESQRKKIKLDDAEASSKIITVHCQYWVKKKNRFCKMTVKNGNKFCGEHSIADETAGDRRIPCPLDSKHSVEVKNLEKHLKKCNARAPENLPEFICKNCNMFDADDGPDTTIAADDNQIKLQDVPLDQVAKVTKKVEKLFAEHVEDKIETIFKRHTVLESELSREEYGDERRKHLLQTSNILGIMESENFFTPNTCFVEYGAGKAELTFWLAQAIEALHKSKIIVVDRQSHRHKKDNLVKDREKIIERIRADIADLKLQGLACIEEQTHFAAVSKHLCGVATDLALRCIVNGNREMAKKTRHILICVCCHHRCIWRSFTGREWLVRHGIDEQTFNLITKMVSWCICGSRDEKKTDLKRELIGWKCKRLLDYARLQYLNENGYETRLCYYIEKSVTPENVCILAKLRENDKEK